MIPSTSASSRRRAGNKERFLLLCVSALVFSSFAGSSVGVESFAFESSPRTTTTTRKINPGHFGFRPRRAPSLPRIGVSKGRVDKAPSTVVRKSSEDDDDDGVGSGGTGGLLESTALASQPVVWISLYFLATTGHGLPAGPGGSIGAVEGIAYLVVVGSALLPASLTTPGGGEEGSGSSALPVDVGTLSRATIALGLLVLASVAAGKGCVPNAKPILDYSAYLPVCGAEP
eukprot:CAMPEP_0197188696 /NCGR_PEP_ID=MMETSP1423-20130617/18307_1 /TAXON_ID=476441 /ORGANISM="Pseudo-nitzschia heimii, Strain UNC1101" /LENGTH=229 /DNA_ID=CAMNT_0042640601 /DNA_START=88 /DNA_END=777 /DNA_ORIENTATION=-